MAQRQNTFTEGKIAYPLLKLALPVLGALFLQSLYGAVDLLVVGRFGDAADVSAVATGSQMMQMVTVVFSGLAVGSTIQLGLTVGQKDGKKAGDIIGASICFFFVLAVASTVLAQALSVLICLFLIKNRGMPFPFGKGNIAFHKSLIGGLLKTGFPIALQDFLVALSFLVINAIVNRLGLLASAGVGVAEKLCAFIMLVPTAFSSSLSAFVAQNVGAKKPERAEKAMRYAMGRSVIAGLVLAYIAYFHGGLFSRIFTSDEAVVAQSWDYLRAYAIDTLLVSFLFCFIGYFNGNEKTTFVMAQGIIGAFCIRIPVAFFASKTANANLFRIGLAAPASTVVQIILCVVYHFAVLRRKQEKAGGKEANFMK